MSIQDRFGSKGTPPHGTVQRVGSLALLAVIVLVVLSILSSSWYTVDQGERGVLLRNGAVIGEAEPGLGFKIPIFDTVQHISIQSQNSRYSDVKTYSRDQQPATLRVSVNYHVTDPRTVYTDYKSIQNMIDRLVTPQVYTWSENIFGQFNAVSAVQDRAQLNNELAIALRKVVHGPLAVESVQIENIDFSGKYEEAVEARMEATVRQQQAEAEAAATRTRADAAAYAVKAQGEAEASAIRNRGDALRDNPGLPALVTAEKWDGHLPTTMVPGGAVPFLKVSP
ncbi:MAG TPA: prohibitin family protein [Rhizomicrobium sp.]|jgi:regulator of protease activity HflC (stomatin/prohibitin superfamily)|nr:prohibitin family protein [Rhizomicrobium sp.]